MDDPGTAEASARAARPPSTRPVLVGVATTLVVALLSYAVPPQHSATVVGLGFLLATYAFALRGDDPDSASRHGLSLGGLLDPAPLDGRRLLRASAGALGWALVLSLVVFPAFWAGFLAWWHPASRFEPAPLVGLGDKAAGELLVIALPEEAFFRGYLQSRLDERWPPRWPVLGAKLGPGVIITSGIFAVGHLLTDVNPSRLAVFFPSLLFGWLRARRGGVGTGAVFHALCNLFASYLGRSYGLYAQ